MADTSPMPMIINEPRICANILSPCPYVAKGSKCEVHITVRVQLGGAGEEGRGLTYCGGQS